MDQLALTACVVLGIVFGFAVARFLSKGAAAAAEAKVKAEAQREAVALSERVASKEARLVELTRDNLDAKRRLEEALDHAARLNGAQAQFDAQLAELKRQNEEKIALVNKSHERALDSLRTAHEQKADQAEKYAVELAARAEIAKEEADALRDEVAALRAEQAESQARIAATAETQAKLFEQNNQAFMDLARATFERFQEQPRNDTARQQSIEEAVRPLRDALARVAGAIAGMERDRVAALSGLSEQVGTLVATQQQIHQETQGLASALRAPASRGRWGEMQLRRVVELAGMIEHCDFDSSASTGALLVHLPSQRLIAVDSNLPLGAYLEAIETGEESRAAKFQEHAAAVRRHISHLSGPAYWSAFATAPELVVAFLPGEAPYSAALEHDPALLEYGAAQRVILATPATLIALLRAAAYGWQQQRLTENAREINALGQSLYQSLENYQNRMNDVRGNLEKTVESYNAAVSTLEGEVLTPVRRFHAVAPAQPIDIRPRAITGAPVAAIAPAALAVSELSAEPVLPATALPVAEVEQPALPVALAEPVAVEPEPELEAEVTAEPEFEFVEIAEFEPEAEFVTLTEAPETAATVEPEPEIVAEASPAVTAEHTPEVETPSEIEVSTPAAALIATEPQEPQAEPEPEPELVAVAEIQPEPAVSCEPAAAAGRTEIEIEEPSFPDFGHALSTMASNVSQPQTFTPADTASKPALTAAGEGSGYFSAFVKI